MVGQCWSKLSNVALIINQDLGPDSGRDLADHTKYTRGDKLRYPHHVFTGDHHKVQSEDLLSEPRTTKK